MDYKSDSFYQEDIQYLLTEPGKKIISVSSTISGEGKTFIATNLASIIAMSNKKPY